jgi:hypothetical protein
MQETAVLRSGGFYPLSLYEGQFVNSSTIYQCVYDLSDLH